MRYLPAAALAVACALLAACASALDKGDDAYMRQDWDAAVQQYEQALRGGLDRERATGVHARLAEARLKAGDVHAGRSARCEASGDLEGACREAELVLRFAPSDAAASRLGVLRTRLGAQLLAFGKAAMDAGNPEGAVSHLTRAQALHATPEGLELLAKAQAAAAEVRRHRFATSVAGAEQAMAARDWGKAATLLDVAHTAGSTSDSLRKADLAKAMFQAESAASTGDKEGARPCFEAALRTGIETDYVRARMYRLLPFDYVITVNEGVVLPFKPDTQMPWDGVAAQRVAEAGRLLKVLSLVTGPETATVGKIGEVVVGNIQSQIEPPDTYLVITVGEGRFTFRDWAQQDTYRPSWNSKISIRGSPSDGDVLTIAVLDRDLEQDDMVGSIQLTASELLSEPGVKEFYFVGKEGQLRAGGLVALRLIVERQER